VEVGEAPEAATGIGLALRAGEPAPVEELEAHPLALHLPDELALVPFDVPRGHTEVLAADFTGPDVTAREDLAGLAAATGGTWERSVGDRAFALGPDGVVVPRPRDATAAGGVAHRLRALARPGGERLAYTVPWPDPALADVDVDVVPPGTARHQGEGSRAGLVFWQGPGTYLMVNVWLDDAYDGTSVSSFLRVGGYEDVFDAVWVNVGRRVTWGVPFNLRTSFDGDLHTTWVDGEPVLYRRVRDVLPGAEPMRIRRVGLLANWEFGQDTGSRFLRIRGRA
jgi:hypothetical protein